jgi:hypothetical protein
VASWGKVCGTEGMGSTHECLDVDDEKDAGMASQRS